MILVAILAWLPMPWEPITDADNAYWYVPFTVEYVDEEPTLEKIEKDLQRRNMRILENRNGQ